MATVADAARLQRPQELEGWRWTAAAAVLAAVLGVAIVKLPLAAFVLIAVLVTVGIASLDLAVVERTETVLLVAGAMCLGYGWANLGIPGAVPIPLTEILLIPLAAIALSYPRTRLDSSVLLPLCLFAILVGIRLVFDFPVWGKYSIRDTTMTIEAFIIAVGYRAVARDGVELWVRRMRYIAGLVLLWGTAYPFIPGLGNNSAIGGNGGKTLGPTVGLQHSAHLIDPRGVKFSVIAAGLYFVVFGRGWRRVAVLGLLAGLLAIYQSRGLYIMLPLGVLVLGWAAHRFGRVLMQIVPAALIAAAIVAVASSHGLQGTTGPVDSAFLTAHAETLLGKQGPHSATIAARQNFIRQTVALVTSQPGTVLVGVGLGPDLTFGQFIGNEGQLVRNPHDTYLEVFARTGIIGFTIWAWLLLACLVPIARRARSGFGVTERFCAWILAACVVYLGVAGTQPLLAFPYGSVPLFFLLGIGVAASRARRRAPMLTALGPSRPAA